LQPHGLLKPIQDTHRDECFHYLAFEEMARWIDGDGQFQPHLEARACVRTLREFLVKTTGVQAMGPEGKPLVTSDGGLGPLFDEFDLGVTVLRDMPT
jgi:hypothetical protein